MKRTIVISLLLVLASTRLFAHEGHAHRFMGTVTMVHGDGSFMMDTTEGKKVTVKTSGKTAYSKTDGSVARFEDLEVGARVVVKMMTDEQTAASVKMSAAKKE
jgi:hypothetical protein